MFYCDLFCVSVSKMYPKVSEKPKKAGKVVTLSVKLNIIVLVLVNKINTYKSMVTAALLYAISVYERFHRNTLLSDSRGTCTPQSSSQTNPKPSPSLGPRRPLSFPRPASTEPPTHLGQELLLVCLHPKAGDAGICQAAAMHQLLHPCDLRHGLELRPRGQRLLGGSLSWCLLFFSILHRG